MAVRRMLAAALLVLAGCLYPTHIPDRYPEIAGVEPGAGGDQVLKSLGNPNSRATGWWSGTNRFDVDYVVWYYKARGRVVFDGPRSLTVVTTEADASEDGRP